MVDYLVSLEAVPPAIGDVGLFSLGLLLFGGAQKIIGGEPQAVRSHDGYEHVTILVVHDVAGGILTERVADLAIFDASVLPREESPGANERIRGHRSSLLAQWVRLFAS
jgi:hypothetical protein